MFQPQAIEERDPSVTHLLSGIVADTQRLAKQQVALLRAELREGVQKMKQAGMMFFFGAITALIGIVLVSFMIVHLLSWAFYALPLWACFGIVGIPLASLGVALLYFGNRRLQSIEMPGETAEAFRENIEWIASPK